MIVYDPAQGPDSTAITVLSNTTGPTTAQVLAAWPPEIATGLREQYRLKERVKRIAAARERRLAPLERLYREGKLVSGGSSDLERWKLCARHGLRDYAARRTSRENTVATPPDGREKRSVSGRLQ